MTDNPGGTPAVADEALNAVEQDAPPAYPAKPSAPSAYSAPDDANAIKPGSAQHDGDEDISDTDDEQPNVTDKQRAQVAAMYLQATSGAGSGGGAGPTAGKEDDSGTDTDEDGALIQKAKEGVKERMAMQVVSKPKGGGRARPGSGITLKMLVDEGMLTPGVGVLSVEYKGSVTVADLLDDGRIWWKGQTFESPSAFSIHIKRLVNPSRKADDGWKTVKYERRYLESFKVALSKQKFEGGDVASAAAEPRGTKRQRVVPAHLADAVDVPAGRNGAASAAAAVANGGVDRLALRRRAAPPPSLGDDHQMVQLQQYRGPPGSGARGAQPFTLQVSAAAEVMMDFHAHLSTHEVIGVLAGYFDPSNHIVRVMHAMPVKELPTENNNINVEMDPEDEHRAREMIQKLNMRCVGWYHSHPHFATMPSLIDVFNQVMQQQAHRDNSLLPYEPYVGAIIGPYDRHMSGTTSGLTWFMVEHPQGVFPGYQDNPLDVDCHPYELKTVPVYGMDNDIQVLLQRSFPELAKRYARMRAGRPNMQESWRDALTRLDKLKASLRSRLPPNWTEGQAAAFVDKVDMAIVGAWTMFQPTGSSVVPQPTAAPTMVPQPVATAGMVPQPVATAGMVPQPVASTMVPQPVATAGMVPQPPPGQM